MTLDIWMLLGAIFLGFVHIGAQSFALKWDAGNAYTLGPRDMPVDISAITGRLERASRNYQESFPFFATTVLTAHLLSAANDMTAIGATLYLGARSLYLPAYAFAIPLARTVLWQVAMIGIVIVASQVVLPAVD